MNNSNNQRGSQLQSNSGSRSCNARTNQIKTTIAIAIVAITTRIIYQSKSASTGRSQRLHRYSVKTKRTFSMEVHSIPARSYLKYKRMHCSLQ